MIFKVIGLQYETSCRVSILFEVRTSTENVCRRGKVFLMVLHATQGKTRQKPTVRKPISDAYDAEGNAGDMENSFTQNSLLF